MLFIIKMSNYNIISRQNYGLVKGAQIMPRKGENIYKRKDGRWEGRFRKYRDANGKIKYGYVYARNINGKRASKYFYYMFFKYITSCGDKTGSNWIFDIQCSWNVDCNYNNVFLG